MNSISMSSKESQAKLKNQSLFLADELPPVYAQPLAWFEKIFAHGEAAYVLALLTGLSVCHRIETRLTVGRNHWFSVPLNLFSGIIGQSGTGKTPLVETIVLKPLRTLEHESWVGGKQKLHSKRYLFSDATGAWLRDQFKTVPSQPLLYFRDGGLPKILTPPARSSYYGYLQTASARNPDLLQAYDGDAVVPSKSGDYKPLMSVLATGVPSRIEEHMNSSKNYPLWPKFLWAKLTTGLGRLPRDGEPTYSVHETLVELYRRALSLPAVEYTLSPEAAAYFCDTCNDFERIRVVNTGMKAVYSNTPGNLARLIGNCHIVHSLAAFKDVLATEISLERVQQGVRLIEFFVAQVKLIRSEC